MSMLTPSPGTTRFSPRRVAAALLLTVASSLVSTALPAPAQGQVPSDARSEELRLPGLDQPVEILKDRWGIAHIYAETEHDLFFAQGWSSARDRLFQLEVWRRQATGTVAEILGPREIDRDRGARLFRYRGDLEQELRHYHPRGVEIVQAFVDGINAYVQMALDDPSLLSVEFEMLGIEPGFWTPEVVISRHQGLLGNITREVTVGRAVAALGPDAVRAATVFEPHEPILDIDPAVDLDHFLGNDVIGLYNAFRGGVDFRPEDVAAEYRARGSEDGDPAGEALPDLLPPMGYDESEDYGSNNWILDGTRTASGFPLMANDPHRVQAAPSLRYWVHLV